MTASTPAAPTSVLDPRITLATALHSQPGVYALLIGSGTSTGAGVPTGWGVVQALVAQAAAAARTEPEGELDPEAWWAKHGDGKALGYSGLLESLASTPAARRALLAGFFEPTDDDRDNGQKVPGPAHRAIAALVRRGAIRVIVTTNFDHLIEQALENEGLPTQVITSAGAIEGMEPLAHARCTVIKLHGDYARIDQLNTVEELSSYGPELKELLDRILDEYGLIINGWSGDWDNALVQAIQGTRSRRYPMFWASYGPLGAAANGLVAQHRAHVIPGMSADQFFKDALDRLEALDRLADPPLSQAMTLARLKKALPNPTKHIELRDLLESEIDRIRIYLNGRGDIIPSNDGPTWQDAHDEIRSHTDTLMQMLAQGVFLDRDRQHTDLWVWVIEQLMRARPQPTGMSHDAWVRLHHYPALLALKSASLAAVAARHDDVLLRLLREPTWRDRTRAAAEPALSALHDFAVLNQEAINAFPKWSNPGWIYARSHLLKAELRPVLLPIVGDDDSYEALFARTEYRFALAQLLYSGPSRLRPAPGEFIWESAWDHTDTLTWEIDFREHADRDVWQWPAVVGGATDPFENHLTQLAEGLKRSRSWWVTCGVSKAPARRRLPGRATSSARARRGRPGVLSIGWGRRVE